MATKSLDLIYFSKTKCLLFAMNAGMFDRNFNPVGLFVEEGIVVKQLNRSKGKGKGNFYTQPNGFFYIDSKSNPGILLTNEYNKYIPLCYATQSGPMLVIDGKINGVFDKNAQSRYIRNGVGIKKDNTVVFILSGRKVNFYDFADFFLKEGCVRIWMDLFPGHCIRVAISWIMVGILG